MSKNSENSFGDCFMADLSYTRAMKNQDLRIFNSGIFLHMGPGGNAQIEKKLLSSDWPQVEFWDQPAVLQKNGSFRWLLDSVIDKTQSLKTKFGSPLHIVAHSFGGHIATQLLKIAPELVASCEFYGTGYDLPTSFLQLLRVMGKSSLTKLELKNKIEIFCQNKADQLGQPEEIWTYLKLITEDSDFLRHYFPSENLYLQFLKVSQSTQPIDMQSFSWILADFIENHFSRDNLSPLPWQGPIQIHLGQRDPLLLMDHEIGLWQSLFPQAKFEIHPHSGHYLHLEKTLVDTL